MFQALFARALAYHLSSLNKISYYLVIL